MADTERELTDFAWYRKRADAVLGGVTTLNTALLPLVGGAPQMERLETITHLLTRLEAFGREHFDFFHKGFASRDLEISSEFPPARVLESIVDQIAFDLEVILRARAQRQLGLGAVDLLLQKADKLAADALEYATRAGSLVYSPVASEQWTVLTYLQKSPSVRVIPYANVALIGVPLSTLQEDRDLLAIPHEVGHVVYWRRARPLGSPVNRSLFSGPPGIAALRKWEEEMFADVYGAIVAGPIIGLDFQELAMEHIPDQFLDEEDDHTPPILRPILYAKIMEARGEPISAQLLLDRWLRNMATRMDKMTATKALTPEQFKLWMRARNDTPNLELGKGNDFDDALKILWDTIKRGTVGNWTGPNFDTKLRNEVADTAALVAVAAPGAPPARPDLYNDFIARITTLVGTVSALNLENPPVGTTNIWEDVLDNEGIFGIGNFTTWYNANKPLKAGDLSDLAKGPNNTWIQIWLATGWTSEAPNSEPKQP